MDDVDFMKEIDAQYRAVSGLSSRKFYSIFYSRICKSPLMVLGINPGGSPEEWQLPDGADEFCSNWHHDYVDEDYPIQAAMLPLLKHCLGIEDGHVRRIPKTNVVFRRSRDEKSFFDQQGMSMTTALTEGAPVLSRLVKRVQPKAIIFEGIGAFERFSTLFKMGELGTSLLPPVTTANGRYRARIYEVRQLETSILDSPVTAIVLGHPSKYAGRAEFTTAREDMKSRLVEIGEELRLLGSPV